MREPIQSSAFLIFGKTGLGRHEINSNQFKFGGLLRSYE
jgi:hypothetical protein